MEDKDKIQLVDEDHNIQEFFIEMTFDVADKTYAILSTDENKEDLMAFCIEKDANGEEYLRAVEDDDEFAEVEDAYSHIADEEED